METKVGCCCCCCCCCFSFKRKGGGEAGAPPVVESAWGFGWLPGGCPSLHPPTHPHISHVRTHTHARTLLDHDRARVQVPMEQRLSGVHEEGLEPPHRQLQRHVRPQRLLVGGLVVSHGLYCVGIHLSSHPPTHSPCIQKPTTGSQTAPPPPLPAQTHPPTCTSPSSCGLVQRLCGTSKYGSVKTTASVSAHRPWFPDQNATRARFSGPVKCREEVKKRLRAMNSARSALSVGSVVPWIRALRRMTCGGAMYLCVCDVCVFGLVWFGVWGGWTVMSFGVEMGRGWLIRWDQNAPHDDEREGLAEVKHLGHQLRRVPGIVIIMKGGLVRQSRPSLLVYTDRQGEEEEGATTPPRTCAPPPAPRARKRRGRGSAARTRPRSGRTAAPA